MAYINLGLVQKTWDSSQVFYNVDPLHPSAVQNMAFYSAVLKNDDKEAQYFEQIWLELTGGPFPSVYVANKKHRVDLQTAIDQARKWLPLFKFPPGLAEAWVRPHYEPSFTKLALQEFRRYYESGELSPGNYWTSLLNLNQTEQAMQMAFDLFDNGRLNQVMFWLSYPGRKEFRSHPRFIELVEHMGLASYWDEVGWPQYCELRDEGYFCGLDIQVQ